MSKRISRETIVIYGWRQRKKKLLAGRYTIILFQSQHYCLFFIRYNPRAISDIVNNMFRVRLLKRSDGETTVGVAAVPVDGLWKFRRKTVEGKILSVTLNSKLLSGQLKIQRLITLWIFGKPLTNVFVPLRFTIRNTHTLTCII